MLQIARDKDFTSILKEEQSLTPFYTGLDLQEGSYWWRVGVLSEGSKSAFTPPRTFTILQKLSSPVITQPVASKDVIIYEDSQVASSWLSVENADYYDVKVQDSSGGTVVKKQVQGLTTMLPLEEGTYTMQVQAVSQSAKDEASSSSTFRYSDISHVTFFVRRPQNVSLSLPENDTNIQGLSALRVPVSFSWHSQKDSSSSYTLLLEKRLSDGTRKEVLRKTLTTTSTSVSRLTEGTYIWKILASSKDGIPLDSSERTFTVLPVGSLAQPVLSSPASNFVIGPSYLRQYRTITFSWRAVSGANSYNFVLYKKSKDGSLAAIYESKKQGETSLTLKDLSILDVGDFVWSVTAFSYASDGYEEMSSRATTRTFSIDFNAPSKVETVQPGTMYGE